MLEKHSDIHQRSKEIIDTITIIMNENSTLEIKDTHNKIKSVLLSVNFRTLQSNFDLQLKNQARFFRNYMKVFEHLLLLLRATRQQIWTLHLTSLHALHALCKIYISLLSTNACFKRKSRRGLELFK